MAYSAGLKYKLACGSLVIAVRSGCDEFFYSGLVSGQHYVSVPPRQPNQHSLRAWLITVRPTQSHHHPAPT